MRKLMTLLLVGALVCALPAIAQGKKKKKPAGPVLLWEDGAGDADVGQGTGSSIPAGWDLAKAEVVRNGDNLEFTVTHHDMPPIGSLPEATRFIWNFTVDGANYRFTVKSADIGKPDVAAGETTERVGRADVQGHFRLEGECVTDATLPLQFVNCPPLEYLTGAFDAAAKTFTVVLPLASVEARPGSVFGPGISNICTICWVSHYAERSLSTTIIDQASQVTTYKVPK